MDNVKIEIGNEDINIVTELKRVTETGELHDKNKIMQAVEKIKIKIKECINCKE